MQDFKELKVWEKAHELTLNVYSVTVKFPKEEIYGLTNQMRRSSASIPSNTLDEYNQLNSKVCEVKRMLSGLLRSLKTSLESRKPVFTEN